MTHYLDMTEGLLSHADDEMRILVEERVGTTPVVFRALWLCVGSPYEGFVSAATVADAKVIVRAHEAGFGREVASLTVARWGSCEELADWFTSRCSPDVKIDRR